MAWLLQRVSAVYLALVSLYALYYFVYVPPQSYLEWRLWLLSTPILLGLILLVFFILLHAWIGIRDVLLDYIPHTGIRLTLLSVIGTMLLACGFWALLILSLGRLSQVS